MNALLLLGCFLLAVGSAHMIPEDRLATNRVTVPSAVCHSAGAGPPPVLIEEIHKSEKKSKKAKKTKKNKFVKKRPPPPPNCVALGGNCKSPGRVCCDFCAFCQCRLFRTVCFCRMGNPGC
ncbi:agouti signaling protein 1 [Betta splendens]|uniref:Agouti-signaling protein n=1 Tax=Betta splendens TaxID=158456 RepID=A0A6P7MMK8_BETSP|nr:agouti signaling protein 1 [Betta splendens]